jgi:hypothetical protein
LEAAWESGIHVFSIDKMNQRKTNLPRAQSIYQMIGEAPWGSIRKLWPEVVEVTQPPNAKLRYEWMEHLMPNTMGILRPDRVAVEDYTARSVRL